MHIKNKTHSKPGKNGMKVQNKFKGNRKIKQ